MSAAHTPGPWRTRALGPWSVDSELGSHSSWAIGTDCGVIAIAVTHEHYDDPEYLANARLIAAAPALLEALDFMVNVSRSTPGFSPMAREQAERALSLAKGESA